MNALDTVVTTVIPTRGVGTVNPYHSRCGKCVSKLAFSLDRPANSKQALFMQINTELLTPKFAAAFLVLILSAQISSAQWIVYNFSPQAAYQASYGLRTGTNSTSSSILTNGWSTSWSNSTTNNRGILAVQFSTNTNTPNVMTCLQPLIYTYSTNTSTLTISNYFTNAPQITLTNTNVTMASSNSNACYILRANFANSVYMAGQYSLVVTNATNSATNTVGTFNSICASYTTSNIGTNGVPTNPTVFSTNGTRNFYPAILQLKISSISGTNTSTNGAAVLNQQLVLPLSINTALTRIVNTNTNFGTNGSPIPTNNIYTNLVKCIRSNSTYTNF
jgi:hypothetical protein